MNSGNERQQNVVSQPASDTNEFWRPFQHLRTQIDRAFEELTHSSSSWHLPWSKAENAVDSPSSNTNFFSSALPAVDLAEKDDCYELTAELPGLEEKDIEITYNNGNLTLRGEKTQEREEKKKDYYLSERRYGAFQRSFRLPPEVDVDRIQARCGKGVLKLTLPKRPDAVKPAKRIEVTGA